MENSLYEKLENIANLATENLSDSLLESFNGYDYDYNLLNDYSTIEIEFQIRNSDYELENTFFANAEIKNDKLILTMEHDNANPYNKEIHIITGIEDNSIIEKIKFYLNEYCEPEIQYLIEENEDLQNDLEYEYLREKSYLEHQYAVSR